MNAQNPESPTLKLPFSLEGEQTIFVKRIFRWINIVICIIALLFCLYWLFATDRYVSEAAIIIQNTDQLGMSEMPVVMSASAGVGSRNEILLQSHLQSVDMLKKLDSALDLRSHYSDDSRDIASRMWFHDASMEWFHRHYLDRVQIYYSPTEAVLRINCQAYTPQMAHDITAMLVSEGEKYMNELSHELARTQVAFLEGQVEKAQAQMRKAHDELIAFQNKKGLLSPTATVETIHKVIGRLEEQRTKLQTQLGALPASINKNHPTRRSIEQSLRTVQRQIAAEQSKLASTKGASLNELVEEEKKYQLESNFTQDIYKSALVALEHGRMEAARTLKQVSVIQSPTMPEYAWEPRRIYGLISTICIALCFLGIARLLRSVVLDHVD